MTMTEQERETRKLANQARAEQLREHLQVGDIITHTRCMDHVDEHRFTGWDGFGWLCGEPTAETAAISGGETDLPDNDIAPLSVTHINRVPVDQWFDSETRQALAGWMDVVRTRLAKARGKG